MFMCKDNYVWKILAVMAAASRLFVNAACMLVGKLELILLCLHMHAGVCLSLSVCMFALCACVQACVRALACM
jgi:hypothetical protein